MKAIIRGKRFDTSKSILIGEAGYSGSRRDFQWWAAALYRTPRSGQFFLAGEGGPMTRWARHVDGGGRTNGSGIVPLELEDAREWAEQYLSTAEVEAAFAEHIEDA